MVQVTQSPFLQALGYAIVNSLWQFAFLWLLYLAINSVASLSSHKKYAAALSLQVAGFCWFIFTLLFYYSKCVYLLQTGTLFSENLVTFGQMPYTGSIKDRVLIAILKTEVFLPYLSTAYLVLLLGLSFNWIKTYRFTKLLGSSKLEKIDVRHRLFVERLVHHLGIKRSVRVFLSHLVSSPLTIGFYKPIILLPFASVNNLSCDQVEAVLLHELAHIKRFDYLMNLVLSVIEVGLFFNPFMQLLSRHIKRERENSCDDWVLQFEYDASSYASALVKLATSTRQPGFVMKAVDQKHTLLLRVKRMLEKQDRTYNYRNRLFAFLFLSGTLSIIAYIAPRTTNAPNANITTGSRQMQAEPLAAHISNPLFNPVFFLADRADHSADKQNNKQPNQSSKEVSIYKIALPIINRTHLASPGGQEDIVQTMEQQANLVYNHSKNSNKWMLNVDTMANLLAGGVEISSLAGATKMLESGMKKLERQLAVLAPTADVFFKINKDKKSIDEAIVLMEKALKTKLHRNKTLMGRARAIASADSIQLHYDELEEAGLVTQLQEQEAKQIEEAYYQREKLIRTGNGHAVGPEDPQVIYLTPQIEPAHTFSYDYKEQSPVRYKTEYVEPGNAVTNTYSTDIDGDNNEVVRAPKPATTPKLKKSARRVIKIVRI